jgi:ribonuclease PH
MPLRIGGGSSFGKTLPADPSDNAPMRSDGRTQDQLRPLACELNASLHAEGSCVVSMGKTRVFCTATTGEELPRWRRDCGQGWVTAEYRMLPRATSVRSPREGRADVKGRTAEIQRLVSRSLRSAVDMRVLGPQGIVVDCDVLQADGGTRSTAINGGMIALTLALRSLVRAGRLSRLPLRFGVAAVSVGLVDGEPLLDLAYDEDSRADIDMNVVMAFDGRLVEVQGTAEGAPFSRSQHRGLLDLAEKGLHEIAAWQEEVLGGQPSKV